MTSPIPELASREALLSYLDRHGDLCGAVVEGVDLRDCELDWSAVPVEGAVFIACVFPHGDVALELQAHGAVVVPDLSAGSGTEARPYRVYPSQLYSYEELNAIDQEVDAWFRAHPIPLSPVEAIAQRLHDTAMTDAIYELIQPTGGAPRRVAGVMGGHGIRRDRPEYEAAVRVGHGLTEAGLFVATGGGPGVMEGANLGAYLTRGTDGAIDHALALLAEAPSVHHDGYADAAESVHGAHAGRDGGESLAIPTWHYGHEPVGRFATHIAKYFANSIREDGLLQIAGAGIVFARGGAGTVQEVFQDVAINAYSPEEERAPMVFLGREFFSATGIWELTRAQAVAAEPPYDHLLTLTDDVDEAVAAIADRR